MNTHQLNRIAQFAELYPALVHGVTRADFHSDHVQLVWEKYHHTVEEQQALAFKFRHLSWSVVRGDTASRNLDWLCDFGDVIIRLQSADSEKLEAIPSTVDFGKLRLRHNEPDLVVTDGRDNVVTHIQPQE